MPLFKTSFSSRVGKDGCLFRGPDEGLGLHLRAPMHGDRLDLNTRIAFGTADYSQKEKHLKDHFWE